MRYVVNPQSIVDFEGLRLYIETELRRIEDSFLTINEWNPEFKVPSSLNVVTGGTPVGSITDIQSLLDGNVYNLPEVTGSPGFDLEVDFTGIKRISGLVVRAYYGPSSSSHYCEVQLYNYSTSTEDTVLRLNPADDYDYRTILLPDGTNYYDGSGNAQVTFYHPTAGNAAHDLYVDYVALLS